jgi:hypothetical protein
MTPTEMARVFLANIEATRALMEDGQNGYILHDDSAMRFICQRRNEPLRLGTPQDDDVSVFTTHASAVVAQRWWNHHHPDNKVKVSLRREALVAYIDQQQEAVDTLMQFVEIEKVMR